MAYGLPVEGDDGPFLGAQLAAVPTCDVGLTVADACDVLDQAQADVAILVNGEGLALGEVDRELLDAQGGQVHLLDVLRPVPSTVRPSVTVASMAEGGGGTALVTSSDGRLLGQAVVAAGDHQGHDHGGQEPTIDAERYEEELASVMKAVEERFHDGEPSAEELRAFLRDRLVADGRSAEDAEHLVDRLEGEQGE